MAGILILLTGQQWIDPLVSVLISLLILVSAGWLLLKTVHILVEGIPEGMNASGVAETMKSVDRVIEIHDLHIWTIGRGYVAFSAHVILEDQMLSQSAEVMEALKALVSSRYQIEHTPIKFECENCGQMQGDHGCI